MYLVTSAQMRKIEDQAIHELMIPSILLMENAAMGCIRHIPENKNIVVLCGPGNNGGDGLAIARLLHVRGEKVEVVYVGDMLMSKGDALVNLQIVQKMELISNKPLFELLDWADVIVDAIFGTGLKGSVAGEATKVIQLVNEKSSDLTSDLSGGFRGNNRRTARDKCKLIISVDIPSGVEADTGKVSGPVIRADTTITFGLPKVGHFMYPGTEYIGHLVVEDISIPREIINYRIPEGYAPESHTPESHTSESHTSESHTSESHTSEGHTPESHTSESHSPDNLYLEVIENKDIPNLLPPRHPRSNKGTYGRVCVIAGCADMPGAAVLCCKASYKTGAGLVHACVVPEVARIIQSSLPEAITSDIENYKDAIKVAQVVALGPGIGRSHEITDFVREVIKLCKENKKPMVIDADGLIAIAESFIENMLEGLTAPCIITPHPGEMAALIGTTIPQVLDDLIGCAQKFARTYGVITLLKDARTVIAAPNGRTFINPTGTPALAKAGSGDVLTGIISALISQSTSAQTTENDALLATALGVYIHGKAGQHAAADMSLHSICASDVADYVAWALQNSTDYVS